MTGRSFRVLILVPIMWATLGAAGEPPPDPAPGPDHDTTLRLRLKPLPAGVRRVWLAADGEGGHWYLLDLDDGSRDKVRPAELAARLERDHRDRTLLYRLLNITSPAGIAWVALGLTGQVLFTGRMLLQWLTSERAGRSVVPVGFWWMSLGGASMLLVYFVWRRDIVGILGQSAGWLIYSRNLWLIFRHRDA
jgi:lipid-A-disaccharide synthase-like uncharacterized protein